MAILLDAVRTQSKVTESVLVSFSGGKDSVVTLDLCMRYFKKVQPFFMYIVPGMRFQERMLNWYEDKYGVEIIRIPHFEASNFYRYGTYRPYDLTVPITKVIDTYHYLRSKTGIWWIAAGERAADSIVRGAMIKNSSSIDIGRGRFFPLAWWRKMDVMSYIKQRKLYLSPEQRELGYSFRSFAGKDLATLKEMYPDDYEILLHYFPFAEVGAKRYEQWKK